MEPDASRPYMPGYGIVGPDEGTTAWVNAKYDTDYSVDFFADNYCYRLRPVSAFGLTDEDFVGSPTRWVFATE
jgi:hypothetical protein